MGLRIGVLALQGDVEAHCAALERAGDVEAVGVRSPGECRQVHGLVIPGGESTTIGKLMVRFGLDSVIRERAADGWPVYGTCAGMILLATDIESSDQPRLGLIDMTVARNAFGRQVDSFETDIHVADMPGEPLRAVFIRAPYATRVGPGVRVLAQVHGRIVAVRQGNLLAGAFHPELTPDSRFHRYFIELVRAATPGD